MRNSTASPVITMADDRSSSPDHAPVDSTASGGTSSSHPSQFAKLLGFFGRLTWMLFGPLALIFATYLVISKGGGWGTAYDVAYFAILGAMLLGRCLEFRAGEPQTAEGQPATKEHLRRYVIGAIVAGTMIWAIANAVGNHWLSS
jgi:hypothetical protein